MIKKAILLSLTAAMLFANGDDKDRIQVISGTGYQYAKISLKYISKLHCSAPISNLIYSKEKEIEIKAAGNDAYIKILPKKIIDGNGEKLEYDNSPRELYLECGGSTFSLILNPENVPPQTLILKSPIADAKKASEYEKSNPYEDTILSLVKNCYTESIPDGYDAEFVGEPAKEFEELSMSLVKRYKGSKYWVEEYLINAKKEINIYESMFIPYLKNSLAISIVKMSLVPNETTRMIVVRLNNGEER